MKKLLKAWETCFILFFSRLPFLWNENRWWIDVYRLGRQNLTLDGEIGVFIFNKFWMNHTCIACSPIARITWRPSTLLGMYLVITDVIKGCLTWKQRLSFDLVYILLWLHFVSIMCVCNDKNIQ
jgi:hypothetical protein